MDEQRALPEVETSEQATHGPGGLVPPDEAPEMVSSAPTPREERHHAIDAVRGFALLGLIVVHLGMFAHPMTDLSPTGTPLPFEGLTRVYFQLSSIFVLGKAFFLFALLFGASVIFFDRKFGSGDAGPGEQLWYRRMKWLAVIGLLHAFLLFWGDVLFLYALCGLAILWRVRRRSVRWLVVGGAVSFVVGTVLFLGIGILTTAEGANADPTPGFMAPEEQLASFGGSFLDATRLRALLFLTNLFLLPFSFWVPVGTMLFGMALMKSGVLTGERSGAFYLRLCLVGLAIGLPLTTLAYHWIMVAGSGSGRLAYWSIIASVLGIPTALGYLGGIVYLVKRRLLQPVTFALSCVGRTAVTNYLLQSAVAGFVFYGYGMGLYGTLEMGDLLWVLLAVWVVNLSFSVLWLRWFRFGPVEWLWRWATYGKRPSLLVGGPRARVT